jgi:hypothetical protein
MSDNVITAGAGPQALLLAIAGFQRDEALWPRAGLNREHVRDLAALYRAVGAGALPPILVVQLDSRRYLADGWHRCAAAEEAGLLHLNGHVKPVARLEDVYLEAMAAAAASEHPLGFTRPEKRAAADRLLALVPWYSDRCIARMAGVSQPFVSGRRKLMEAGKEPSAPERRSRLPSRRAAAGLLSGARALDRLQRHARHCTAGEPLDPAAAILEALEGSGAAGDALLANLTQWMARVRRARGSSEKGERP